MNLFIFLSVQFVTKFMTRKATHMKIKLARREKTGEISGFN